MAWIQLFDFEVQYIFGQKHSVADGTFRQPPTAADIAKTKAKEDINDFILAELNCLQMSPIFLDKPISFLANNYSDYLRKIAN